MLVLKGGLNHVTTFSQSNKRATLISLPDLVVGSVQHWTMVQKTYGTTTAHLVKLGYSNHVFFEVSLFKPKPSKLKPKEHRKTHANKTSSILQKKNQKHVSISLFRTLSAYSAHFIASFHKKGSCFRMF